MSNWYAVNTSSLNPWNQPLADVYHNTYTDYNAWLFYTVMKSYDNTIEDAAIAGIAGNILYESIFNPQEKQNNGPAYGLIQWDPKSDLTSVVPSGWDYTDGDSQTWVIYNEIIGVISGRFFANHGYNYSGAQFLLLTNEVEAARAYFWERERGPWNNLRETFASYFYALYTGGTPPTPPPEPPSTEDDVYPALLLLQLIK